MLLPIKNINKAIELECKFLHSDTNFRGVPNIVDYNRSKYSENDEWEVSKAEIGISTFAMSDYIAVVATEYKKDTALDGILLIKQIEDQYYLVPVGVPDFILKCTEIAKSMKLKIVE